MSTLEVGIIGLGKFGFFLGKSLVDLGHRVLGIDTNDDMIKRAQHVLTQVYKADASDPVALAQLGIAELSNVVVSVGHSMGVSILIAMHLKELGCPKVVVKAISSDHEKVLKKVGVDEIVFPERFAAEQLARRIAVPGLIEYLPVGQRFMLKELLIDQWQGKTLRGLDLINLFGLQVVAVKKSKQEEFNFPPRADQILEAGDVLAVLGQEENLMKVKP